MQGPDAASKAGTRTKGERQLLKGAAGNRRLQAARRRGGAGIPAAAET